MWKGVNEINLIQLYMVFTITTLVWLGLLLVFFYFITKSKEAKTRNKEYYHSRRFKLNINKKWYRALENYLKEAGYILIPETFIIVHLLAIVLIIYSTFQLGFERASRSVIPALFAILFLINMLIGQKAKERKDKIRLELCNIQDVMYFQNRIGTSEDVILTYASKIAKSPLKEPLEYLATAPKVKKTIETALEDLRQVSNVVELQSFSFILEQRQETGKTVENHKAQSQMMKRNKRLRRRIQRQYKRTKLVIASLMLFTCYVMLLTVPLFVEVIRSLDLMFR